jgi:hypothetical protein
MEIFSMLKKKSIVRQVDDKISRSRKRNVFIRQDFSSISDYDQIGRALLSLTRQGKLIRLGYGLYAKTRKNRITGLPMLAAKGGFDQVAKEALTSLGVKWKPSIAEQNYNTGLTTQIPVNTQVLISGRFNHTIGTQQFKLQLQRHLQQHSIPV